MAKYDFYQNDKCTVWHRTYFTIEAASEQEAYAMATTLIRDNELWNEDIIQVQGSTMSAGAHGMNNNLFLFPCISDKIIIYLSKPAHATQHQAYEMHIRLPAVSRILTILADS